MYYFLPGLSKTVFGPSLKIHKQEEKNRGQTDKALAHPNRTIAITSDFRVDGPKTPEIPQKEVLGLRDIDTAARNRKSLATLYRALKSQ